MSRPEGIPATWHDQETDERAAFRHCWAYRPAPGAEPLGYVARFERADGGKLVVPFFKLNGAPGRFKAGAAAEPRPLFGLDRLDAPGPLFVVEGEKDASALHRLGLAAVTAPGGSKASCSRSPTRSPSSTTTRRSAPPSSKPSSTRPPSASSAA
ncbi:MAG: hypothetical protein JSR94_02385, partial [Proteobacteria bacterium]|nr:hypothetical protein [Pseudomonadota bacterium]